MAPSFASSSTHVNSAPVPDQAPQESAATPAPRKKTAPRSTALADAKNVLRAASAVTSKSLNAPSPRRSAAERGPQFIHRTPELAHHRRKCAVCHHPEREAIEDLFIHWHSPSSIASYYDDGDEESNEKAITWVSIYRHAYAFGLDEIRRRNLRFAFELLLEQADQITPTSATLIAAARALGSCVNANGAWNEPPKRVLVTNIIRNESPQTASAAQIENHTVLGNNDACVGADRSHRPAPSETNECSSDRARPESIGEGRDVVTSQPTSANGILGGQSLPAQAGFSFDTEMLEKDSSFRACPDSSVGASHPREVVDFLPASLPPGFSASPEIRNSLNHFNSNEPPISNR